MSDASIGAIPDFGSGGLPMSCWIRRIAVLIGEPEKVGFTRRERACGISRAVGTGHAVGENDLSAVDLEQRQPLGTRVARHADGYSHTGRGSQHRIGDGGVAAGRIEQPLAGQLAATKSVPQDSPCRAVLHAPARIQPLGLEPDLTGTLRRQRQEWRVTNL